MNPRALRGARRSRGEGASPGGQIDPNTDSINTNAGIGSGRYYCSMIGPILYFYALSLVRSPLNCVK